MRTLSEYVVTCPHCEGKGSTYLDDKCYRCGGTGTMKLEESGGHLWVPGCQCHTCAYCHMPACWAAKVCPGETVGKIKICECANHEENGHYLVTCPHFKGICIAHDRVNCWSCDFSSGAKWRNEK